MNMTTLNGIARALVADDKGILAMDENSATCNRAARRGYHGAGIPLNAL